MLVSEWCRLEQSKTHGAAAKMDSQSIEQSRHNSCSTENNISICSLLELLHWNHIFRKDIYFCTPYNDTDMHTAFCTIALMVLASPAIISPASHSCVEFCNGRVVDSYDKAIESVQGQNLIKYPMAWHGSQYSTTAKDIKNDRFDQIIMIKCF